MQSCIAVLPEKLTVVLIGLHELDEVYRKVTLENPAIKAVARDLKFHHDPVGAHQRSVF